MSSQNDTGREIPVRQETDLTTGYYNPELRKSVEYAKKYKVYSKIYSIISLAVFSAAVIVITSVLVFMKRPDVSEIEKRKLAAKPEFSFKSFFDGDYTYLYTEYFSDTVPFREKFVGMNSYLRKLRGISAPTFYGNVEIVSDDDQDDEEYYFPEPDYAGIPVLIPPDEQPRETVTAAPVQPEIPVPDAAAKPAVTEAPLPPASETTDVSEFVNNGIVVDGVKMYGQNAGVMLFGGNKKQGQRYAEIINKYYSALGDRVNVYNIVVPTSAEFYLPEKFKQYSSSEKNAIDHIYSCLAPGVTAVDAYSMLEAHKDEYIYFRTDHHWTPLGAYYAYAAFAEALGMDYHPISDYEEKVKYDYIGSLYGYTNDITLKNSPEEFHYFLPPEVKYTTEYYNYDTLASRGTGVLFHEYVDGSNCYGMFLGADAVHTKITTNAGSGRKIVVFKESYGNAFVPFLVNNFDEIYVIDIRYFGTNAVGYIKRIGATDVLFIDNCFAANTSSLISGIERLYESPTGTVVTTVTAAEETTVPASQAQTKPGAKPAASKKNKKDTTEPSGKKTQKTSSKPQTAPPAAERKPAVTTVPASAAPREAQTVLPVN